MNRRAFPQSVIDGILRQFPGISAVRAHQIARDREAMRRRAPALRRTPIETINYMPEGGDR
ncbi:hypothetical protein [Pelagerythrobacter sp.]|uniref:hypothetical protein n=1 Tax=Pelagerythrobacter sp. TaxID=2800702 RepID=UPI0035AE6D0B